MQKKAIQLMAGGYTKTATGKHFGVCRNRVGLLVEAVSKIVQTSPFWQGKYEELEKNLGSTNS